MSPAAAFPGPLAAVWVCAVSWLGVAVTLMLLSDLLGGIGLAAIGIAQALGVGLVATLAARSVPEPRAERLGLRGFAPGLLPWMLLLAPLALVVARLDAALEGLLPELPAAEEAASAAAELAALDPSAPLHWLELALVAVGLSPVVEEFLYRGVLQQGLVARLGRAGGVACTAVLFALAHVQPWLPSSGLLAAFLAATLLGAVLGVVRLAGGSLLAPILVHAAYNAVALGALWWTAHLAPDASAADVRTPLPPQVWVPAAAAVVAGLAGLGPLASRSPRALPLSPARRDDD